MGLLAYNTKFYNQVNWTDGDYILVPDVVTYLVQAIGGNVQIQISMNTPDEIIANTADWFTISTVTAGNFQFTAQEFGFNGMRFVTSGVTFKAWIKK